MNYKKWFKLNRHRWSTKDGFDLWQFIYWHGWNLFFEYKHNPLMSKFRRFPFLWEKPRSIDTLSTLPDDWDLDTPFEGEDKCREGLSWGCECWIGIMADDCKSGGCAEYDTREEAIKNLATPRQYLELYDWREELALANFSDPDYRRRNPNLHFFNTVAVIRRWRKITIKMLKERHC